MRHLKNGGRRVARPTGQSGFTLVEVALASVILLGGLLTVAQLFVLSALYNQSSKQTTLATSLAHRKMEQLLALPLTDALVDYGGSLTSDSANTANTANFFEDYYIDPTTKQVGTAPFFSGQPVTYKVRWQIGQDPGGTMTGLRVITVRAAAQRAAMIGNGISGANAAAEVTQLSTIRTPSQ